MKMLFRYAAVLILSIACANLWAQDEMSDVTIETVEVRDSMHVLYGRGGNIGVSSGEEGVILIDDQYAPLTDRVREAVASIHPGTIRFVLNTHWHGDHTGGNENLGEAGAIIVAHDNVRERMSTEQFMVAFDRTVPASPEAALPVVTFNDTVTFHWNDDTITVEHTPHAHTDGDSIVHFEQADVLHMGDTFFNSGYPFVDMGSGGTVQGIIAAAERGLELAGESTRIIPGHGEITDRAGLERYHRMLTTITGRVRDRIAQGQSLETIRSADVTEEFDERWSSNFIDSDRFVGFVYRSLEQDSP